MDDMVFHYKGFNISPNLIKIFKGNYNNCEYESNEELNDFFKYVKELSYFKNKNKEFNLLLAHGFIKTYRYDLIKDYPFFVEVAKQLLVKYFDDFKRELPEIIMEGEKEKEKYAKLAKEYNWYNNKVKLIEKEIDNLKLIQKEFDKYSLNIAKSLFSAKGLKYIINDVFIESLFDKISYLFNDIFTDSKIKEECPAEIKDKIKSYILNIGRNISFVSQNEFLERIVSREIYKNKISESEILYLLDFIKVNNNTYLNTIVSNKFIKLEVTNYKDLVKNIVNKTSLNKISRVIGKIKNPKPHMLEIKEEIDENLKKTNELDNIFKKIDYTQQISLRMDIGRNHLLKLDNCASIKMFFSYLKKQQIEKLGFNSINVITAIHDVVFTFNYTESLLGNLDTKYFEEFIKIIVGNKDKLNASNYSNLYDELLNFRMNYMINITSTKKEPSQERKKRKI